MRIRRLLAGFAATLLIALPAWAQQLSIWHDLGDNGTKWLAEAGAEFAKSHPGVSVRAISYPTDQWFGRAIGALNTGSAPDLLFNNYERVIRVATQTGKIEDLRPVLDRITTSPARSTRSCNSATARRPSGTGSVPLISTAALASSTNGPMEQR